MHVGVGAFELQRLLGVVRHREGLRLEGAHIDRIHITRHMHQPIEIGAPQRCMRTSAHPHRDPVAQGQGLCATNVVRVFVGDEDGVQIFRL
ncbi:hypothetical protein D3C71_1941600 [compost metagenome]